MSTLTTIKQLFTAKKQSARQRYIEFVAKIAKDEKIDTPALAALLDELGKDDDDLEADVSNAIERARLQAVAKDEKRLADEYQKAVAENEKYMQRYNAEIERLKREGESYAQKLDQTSAALRTASDAAAKLVDTCEDDEVMAKQARMRRDMAAAKAAGNEELLVKLNGELEQLTEGKKWTVL